MATLRPASSTPRKTRANPPAPMTSAIQTGRCDWDSLRGRPLVRMHARESPPQSLDRRPGKRHVLHRQRGAIRVDVPIQFIRIGRAGRLSRHFQRVSRFAASSCFRIHRFPVFFPRARPAPCSTTSGTALGDRPIRSPISEKLRSYCCLSSRTSRIPESVQQRLPDCGVGLPGAGCLARVGLLEHTASVYGTSRRTSRTPGVSAGPHPRSGSAGCRPARRPAPDPMLLDTRFATSVPSAPSPERCRTNRSGTSRGRPGAGPPAPSAALDVVRSCAQDHLSARGRAEHPGSGRRSSSETDVADIKTTGTAGTERKKSWQQQLQLTDSNRRPLSTLRLNRRARPSPPIFLDCCPVSRVRTRIQPSSRSRDGLPPDRQGRKGNAL